MKFKLAILSLVLSFGAGAATNGHGEVKFLGEVVDAPCSIAQDSANQEINFGQLSKSFLNTNGNTSKPITFDIRLENCDISNFKKTNGKTGSVQLSFTGANDTSTPDELLTSGVTNTAIVIYPEGVSKKVKFDGSQGDAIILGDGNNTLHYTAIVKKAAQAFSVEEGAFSAVANFNLSYQ